MSARNTNNTNDTNDTNDTDNTNRTEDHESAGERPAACGCSAGNAAEPGGTGPCCSATAQATCCATEAKSACCGAGGAPEPEAAATPDRLPVAVLGGGPVGLAAAAHLLEKGETPLVFEAGADVGAGVRSWGHVRMFSPWKYAVDAAARRLLEPSGWVEPDPEEYPTGADLYERYLRHLAALPRIAPHLRLGARVVSVSRAGLDRMKDAGRADAPFRVVVRDEATGEESAHLARAVIDATGTYHSPNPLGAGGVPALGERAPRAAERITYRIPDLLGRDRARYAGKRVAVVGSGHSAFNALRELAALAESDPGTRVTWAVRRATLGQVFGGGERDALAARGELGRAVRSLTEAGRLELVTGFRAERVEASERDGSVTLVGEGGERLPPADEVIALTGFRPDLSILAEVRLGLDPAVEAPVALAPMIDPNVHSCGTVRPHGAAELAHPAEPDFYVAGMKSYGRAPTFLLLTGYEQVRSIACALTGDEAGAAEVRLELPETGVCGAARPADDGVPAADSGGGGGACCGVPAPGADRAPKPKEVCGASCGGSSGGSCGASCKTSCGA